MALEPAQAELLSRIVEGPTIDADALRCTGPLSDRSAEGTSESAAEGEDVTA